MLQSDSLGVLYFSLVFDPEDGRKVEGADRRAIEDAALVEIEGRLEVRPSIAECWVDRSTVSLILRQREDLERVWGILRNELGDGGVTIPVTQDAYIEEFGFYPFAGGKYANEQITRYLAR